MLLRPHHSPWATFLTVSDSKQKANCRIKNILDGIEKIAKFQIHSHTLNVYGECKKNCLS